MNGGGILFTAVYKRIFNECSIKIHRPACMRAINSFPINITRRSPFLGILIKSKRESFPVRFSKLEKYFILLTSVWPAQACLHQRKTFVQGKQKNWLAPSYFRWSRGLLVRGGVNTCDRRIPPSPSSTRSPNPWLKTDLTVPKTDTRLEYLWIKFFISSLETFTFCLNCGN